MAPAMQSLLHSAYCVFETNDGSTDTNLFVQIQWVVMQKKVHLLLNG